jgi:Spy/CpxP family protein refolding chaperone
MRKMIPALLFASLLPTLSFAAPEPADDLPPPPPGMHIDGAKDHRDMKGGFAGGPFRDLDLTPEQHRAIGKLMSEGMHERQEVTHKYLDKLPEKERQAMKDELKATHEKTQKAIREQLTPDQRRKFDEMAKKREQRQAEWAEFQQWKKEHKPN